MKKHGRSLSTTSFSAHFSFLQLFWERYIFYERLLVIKQLVIKKIHSQYTHFFMMIATVFCSLTFKGMEANFI